MAEIIGVLTGIIAVAETSLQIVQQIEKARRRLLFSFKQIPEARDKISLITDSLKSVRNERALQTASVKNRVNQIQAVIQELHEFLEQLKSHSKGMKQRLTNVLTGPRKEKHLSQLLSRLDELMPFLHFDITVAQSRSHQRENEHEDAESLPQEDEMDRQLTTTTTTASASSSSSSPKIPASSAKPNEGRRVVPTLPPGSSCPERPQAARAEEARRYEATPRQSIDSDTTFDNNRPSPMSEGSETLVEEPIGAGDNRKPQYEDGRLKFLKNKIGDQHIMVLGHQGNVRPGLKATEALVEDNVFGNGGRVFHGNMDPEVARMIYGMRL